MDWSDVNGFALGVDCFLAVGRFGYCGLVVVLVGKTPPRLTDRKGRDMTDDVPEFYLRKANRSVDYYLGFQSALRWYDDEAKQWLDETFGQAPSAEKRAAYLAFQHIAAKARVPIEATIAAYDAAKAAGKVHEVEY